ncbi:hypothetical protein OVS_01190 [Mycoplasma ovis str. Michigan]|uniref:Uncharacterized protein n=1 Tax=Mycoplasma ovis str. Michigan TaxID=1415773 RepID=A0ABN4BPC3_9MOLU|nr:hypothetical protein OVS_01190 [Mycoplasma ovis str. Michigan]
MGVSKTIPKLCFSSWLVNSVAISPFQSKSSFSFWVKDSGRIQATTFFDGKLMLIHW